jgi:predicted DNA-binding transcriptional regulator YafY
MRGDRTTAEAQLERILHILPAAARDGGRTVDQLAAELDVTPQQVLRDLGEATARSYYHPGGTVEPFTIFVTRRRVHVQVDDDFNRPSRLNGRELLALALGLRALAAESDGGRRSEIEQLTRRLEAALAAPDVTVPADDAASRGASSQLYEDGVDYEAGDVTLDLGDDAFRGIFADAVQRRVLCTILYMKQNDRTLEQRRIAAYRLVYADGHWYVAAYDVDRGGLRFFRMDRVLQAELGNEPAPPQPDHYDDWIASAPFRASDEIEVTVRYDRTVAPWLLESVPCEVADDGSVLVRHRVADAAWLARHVLRFGGAAVVQAPRQAAQWVAEAAGRLVG